MGGMDSEEQEEDWRTHGLNKHMARQEQVTVTTR